MTRWFGKCLCILAALAVTDSHLMFVQGWAWGTMLQDRTPERGVSEALESTFSGEEPCPMCCAVQDERHEEQEEAPVPESNPTVKWVPVDSAGCEIRVPGVLCHRARGADSGWLLTVRRSSPEVPPPRHIG